MLHPVRLFLFADFHPYLPVHFGAVLRVIGKLVPEDVSDVVQEPCHRECDVPGLISLIHYYSP